MKENKLIAEFMEWDINDPKTFPKPIQQPIYDGCWGDYRFQTSWDWLMPVIAKIVEDYGSGWSFEEGYDLEVRYKSVVNFIKECNNERNR